ncbi:hypothetical protein BUALT_Bualt02G0173200 [Buddleja alternifolia]|uniref:Cysteine proteinase inhibitor n=1 Tax=Buddleja alternifolia TaxID=168488 RepID=A0AAV6Y569_9LAMI|nr:hypothetical protein BUALT_Bualt02G0172900 [Buddleja alternifolia]KAG8388898.1 hypothetical protein BUALT_Bualt02G0173200 [Buddleja alternifolia]
MATEVISPIQGINKPYADTKDGEQKTEYGGITQIPDAQHDIHIIHLARWAVDDYNKETESSLKFKRVVSAKKQIVSGINYYIILEATDHAGHHKKTYEATVWEMNSRELLDFKELHHH